MYSNVILFNCTVLVLCIISCHLPGSVKAEIEALFLSLFVYFIRNSGIILSFVILFVLLSFLFIFITSLITDIQVGKPPLGGFLFAYKYDLLNKVSCSDVIKTTSVFKRSDPKIQIWYEKRIGPIGLAYGAMVNEDIDQFNLERRSLITELGYYLFQIKESENALFVSCPKVPWLSHLGTWLILRILYPRIYKYSKDHKLSAYPVIEVYRSHSVALVVPLSKQDNFVVPEARPLMRRAACNLSHSYSTSHVNVSYSTNSSSSHSSDIPLSSRLESKASFCFSTKLVNGHSKQG